MLRTAPVAHMRAWRYHFAALCRLEQLETERKQLLQVIADVDHQETTAAGGAELCHAGRWGTSEAPLDEWMDDLAEVERIGQTATAR